MIPNTTARLILTTARIEDVVADFLALRRSGSNLTALCPFHHEKTPSFSVSPARNTFKCFGCGKGGNAAKFLMEHEGFSFPEALRWLAKKYNIEIQETKPTPEQLAAQQEEESLFIVNDFALKFFQNNLPGTGLDYLKSRGFTEATIQKFGLGFAPDTWDALTKTALQAGFKLEHLQKLGLATPSGKDFFRNRAIFPIHNLSGKVIAFAGRTTPNSPNSTNSPTSTTSTTSPNSPNSPSSPKYLNSPESPIYHKSEALYGIHLAKRAIRQQDGCILVEGYTDLIALHQAGIENVVASAGTALTTGQLLLIRRFTPNLHLLFDGDPAGIAAAMRGLDLALELGLNVKVTPLPRPEDPDSFLRKVGITDFTEYLAAQSKDFIAFKASILLAGTANDPVKKAAAVHAIVDSIARVPDPVKRSFFTKDCALLVGLSEDVLTAETNKEMRALAKKQQPSGSPLGDGSENSPLGVRGSSPSLEANLVRLLLEHGADRYDQTENITVAEHILANIEDVLEHFEDPRCLRICRESIELVLAKKPVATQYFAAHEDLEISSFVAGLASLFGGNDGAGFSPNWSNFGGASPIAQPSFTKEITHAILRLKFEVVSRWSGSNRNRLEAAQQSGDSATMLKLLKVQSKLDEMRSGIARELGLVAA